MKIVVQSLLTTTGTDTFSYIVNCPTVFQSSCTILDSLSCVRLFVIPWTAARQASLSFTNSQNSLKLMSTESVMPFNHLIRCHPLLSPSILPSIRVFSNESVLHIRWPKYWRFSFSISASNECSGLISFRINWLDLLAVQETLKSLLQHHSSNISKGPRPWLTHARGDGLETWFFFFL